MNPELQLHEPGSNPDLLFSIGIPHNWDNFHFSYINSLIGLCLYEGSKSPEYRLLGSILPQGSCYVDQNRSMLALDHINKTQEDYLVMVDTDVAFSHDILEKLYDHVNREPQARVIAGRVDLANGLPVFYKVDRENDCNVHQPFPFKGLQEFDLVGTGIICIHRSVFLELFKKEGNQHFFNRVMLDNNVLLGDDFSFCARCQKHGIKIYGAWDVFGLHHKNGPVRSAYLNQEQLEIRRK
jgi:hypothetical protein